MKSALVLSCALTLVISAKLPSYFKICKNDENINRCALENGNLTFQELYKGDPTLKLPSLHPFAIDELNLDSGPNLKITFRNVKVYGSKDVHFEQINIDFAKKFLRLVSTSPKIDVQGDYEMNGRILILPIVGNGKANVIYENIYFDSIIEFDIVENKGKEYLKLKNYTLEYKPERVRFAFTNLFNGDKRLGDEMNAFLNENWQEIDKEVGAAVSESIKLVGSTVFNAIARIPLRDLLKN